jgi:hypothetical protein
MKHAFIWADKNGLSGNPWADGSHALITKAATTKKVKVNPKAIHDLITLAYSIDEEAEVEARAYLMDRDWVFKEGGKKYYIDQDKDGTIWAVEVGRFLNEPDPNRPWEYKDLAFRYIDEQGREWYSKAAPVRFTKYNLWTHHEERPMLRQSTAKPIPMGARWTAANWANSLQHIPIELE